jgi:hypothetical protein
VTRIDVIGFTAVIGFTVFILTAFFTGVFVSLTGGVIGGTDGVLVASTSEAREVDAVEDAERNFCVSLAVEVGNGTEGMAITGGGVLAPDMALTVCHMYPPSPNTMNRKSTKI